MEIEIEIAKFWWQIGLTIMGGLLTYYSWTIKKDKSTSDHIDTVEHRLTVLEETVKHLPGADDINAVRDMVQRIGGDVRGLTSDVSGLRELIGQMRGTLQLMNEFLMRDKK